MFGMHCNETLANRPVNESGLDAWSSGRARREALYKLSHVHHKNDATVCVLVQRSPRVAVTFHLRAPYKAYRLQLSQSSSTSRTIVSDQKYQMDPIEKCTIKKQY